MADKREPVLADYYVVKIPAGAIVAAVIFILLFSVCSIFYSGPLTLFHAYFQRKADLIQLQTEKEALEILGKENYSSWKNKK